MSTPIEYNPREIETKWQEKWEEMGIYRTQDDPSRQKFYLLSMFPYPSGNLHTGHWYAFAPADAYARFMRMQGYNVLFPIGFDAFGLPAENAAIKRNIHPKEWTYKNIEHMRWQFKRMGPSFDWSREIITCEPEYYRWNQWFFLQFYKRGLAYREKAPVDWCPTCNTTLAREQVVGEDRRCERCDTPVIKRELEQWKLRITNYAEELLNDIEKLEWPESIKVMQRNWIGKSRGATIRFPVEGVDDVIEVFTTRPDTVYGATFMVLAPEHPLVEKITTPEQREAVEAYKYQAARQSEIERMSTEKEKTGVFTGGYAINPFTKERIPIWIADYVLMGYGTGAIMAVPSGDERDWEFATKYNLPIRIVVVPPDWDGEPLTQAYTGPGKMVNSGPLTGRITLGKYWRDEWNEALAKEYGIELPPEGEEAKEAIIAHMEAEGIGHADVTYRLRDWLISRQRYWGTPIPIVYCPTCGTVPVPEEELPITLPDDVDFRPTGESPLKFHEGFRNTTCPQCGGPAERETDTMDTFVDSSWYQYRYLSPHYDKGPFDPSQKHWLPVDQYTGGAEHAVMHLLYARFWTKVMRDMGMVDFDEPFPRLYSQGVILGPDGQKMSKSRGNVVDPDALVDQYGADTVRGYLMFIGPWNEGGPFSTQGIEGMYRFLNRVWDMVLTPPDVPSDAQPSDADVRQLERRLHQTIRDVTNDLRQFAFNTAIAALMKFSNDLRDMKKTAVVNHPLWRESMETFIKLMAPLMPHIAEEMWVRLGNEPSVHTEPWPTWDEARAAEEAFELVIQVNGKTRDKMTLPVDISEEEAKQKALESPNVQRHLAGKSIKRVIYVPGRLLNIVAK